jgi:uncharacterized membrane protein
VLVALVTLVGAAVPSDSSSERGIRPTSTDAPDGALTALRECYATGDIDAEEFEERRARLLAARRS